MDRLNRLNAVVNEVAEERAQRFAGRNLEVCVPLLIGVKKLAFSLSFLASMVPFPVSNNAIAARAYIIRHTHYILVGALRGHKSKGCSRDRNCIRANQTQQAGVNFLYLYCFTKHKLQCVIVSMCEVLCLQETPKLDESVACRSSSMQTARH